MFTDDKYSYQRYSPKGLGSPRGPAKTGRPIDPKNYNSQNAQTLAASVAAFRGFQLYVNDEAVQYAAETALKDLRPQTDKLMPPFGGVLMVVRKISKGQELRFDLAWIAGAGREPGAVFDEYRATPILVRTLSPAWDADFEYYWVTPRADRSAINASA